MAEQISSVQSGLIKLRHGFFTRHGGASEGSYASLNATARVGDSEENVLENRARALKSLNLQPDSLAFLDFLEHGNKILSVTEAARGVDFNGYDAIMTNQANVTIGLSVADCPPVLLVSEIDGAIALAHAGWRGCAAEVVPKTVEAMIEEFDVDPANIRACIGPSMQAASYEVKTDVTSQFDNRYIVERDGSTFLDMQLVITDQLVEVGVTQIENTGIDTYVDQNFFSHRRDNGDTGRNLCIASL